MFMSPVIHRFSLLFALCFTPLGAAYAATIAPSGGGFVLQSLANGTVWAWGSNSSGQLGDGTAVLHAVPQQVPGLTNVIAVAAGGTHSLALKGDGTVWAWGANGNGQLGVGSQSNNFTPVQVTGLTGITAISAGTNHSIALKSDGTVWAWGANGNGQLGDGTTTQRLSPVQATGLTVMTAIAASGNFSLAVKNNDTAWAWGQNASGQLGDNSTTQRTSAVQVSGLTGITQIAAGGSHSLARKSDGTAWAWGLNTNGQLGDNSTTQRLTPVQVNGLTGVTRVAGGTIHSLALKSDNTVWAWGDNVFGQLGDGTTTPRLTPVQATAIIGATQIESAGFSSMALIPVDQARMWGSNGTGQMGNGSASVRPVPLPIAGLSGITQAAAGNNHTLALKNDLTVWGVGNNTSGQLGDNSTNIRLIPVQVSGLTGVTAIAVGGTHSLALKNDGTVWAWGNNGNGQLGDNTTTNSSIPVQVSGLTGITAIAAGTSGNHSLALKNDGTVWAWGNNGNGQLGDNSQTQRTVPVQVSGLTGITAIAGGNNFSLARKNDGAVWAWGNNGRGQLGDGTFTQRLVPVKVSNLTAAEAIAAGNDFSLARRSDGTVWAWGNNFFGQLGDSGNGSNAARNTPGIVLDGFAGFLTITAGAASVAATGTISSAVGAVTWGGNSFGQLGDGTFNDLPEGTPVLGFAGKTPSSFSMNNHTLAVMTDGTLFGWGNDAFGQLGDSPAIVNATPTAPVARGAADLKISKTHVDDGSYVAGSPTSYTITVQNIGGLSMSGTITVTDTLPAGMSYLSGTGTGWSCSAITGGATCTNPGPLGAGASSVITLTVNTTAGGSFPFASNLATVSNGSDLHAVNNVTSTQTFGGILATMTLTAAPTPNPSLFGKNVLLTATVTPPAATGFISFYDGVTFLGQAALAAGTAQFNTIMLPAGVRTVRARVDDRIDLPYFVDASLSVQQTVNTVASGLFVKVGGSPFLAGGLGTEVRIATGDINGDGKLDVVSLDLANDGVNIFLGDGTGFLTKTAGSPFAAGNGPAAVAVADFNSDGKADLAIANRLGNSMSLLLGDGLGGFTAAPGSPWAVLTTPTTLVVGDFNNDEKADVVVNATGVSSHNPTLFLGDGLGNFTPWPVFLSSGAFVPYTMNVGDFTGDGRPDLVVGDWSATSVDVLQGYGNGFFSLGGAPAITVKPIGSTVEDLNADGKADVVVFDSSGTGAAVLLGNGTGGFTVAAGSPILAGRNIYSIAVGDFNADGKPDLFVTEPLTSHIAVMIGNGAGGFTEATASGFNSTLANDMVDAVVGDFTGDGRTDLALSNWAQNGVMVLRGAPPLVLQPVSVTPAFGSALTQTMTFTFNAPNGHASFTVVNVLINNAINGIGACYVAFVPSSGSLFLVDDAGNAGGPYAGMTLPGSNTIQNSQCSIAGTGSSFSGSGNTLTLTLAITFKAPFAGNKIIYMAAQDNTPSNSGWQTIGVWKVPGAVPPGPAVGGVSPGRNNSATQTYTFTFTDTNGFADLAVMNVLINNAINGIGACYIAFVPSGPTAGAIYLVDDAGNAGGPFAGMVLPGTGSVSNSQCTINGTGSSVSGSGNTLTLTLNMTLKPAFTGNRVIYMAARSNTLNSGWQAMGTVNVP